MATNKPDSTDEESDILRITPLGSGQEVGRSCHYVQFKGKHIMLDCGIHPGREGLECLPFLDAIDPEAVDLLLISHFHLDHAGALPWFLEKTRFRGRCFMTHATKAIYRWLLADYCRVSKATPDQALFTEKDVEKSMARIETINFEQEVNVRGVKLRCYNAGHVLGAGMFLIEIAGVKILYTGDYSCEEDRHLKAAEIPNVKPDILIVEATYGTQLHEPQREREQRFTSIVHDIVTRGGRCLIPAFALGRAQELLLILEEYWDIHPTLHDIPVFYASQLARKSLHVYQTFVSSMNARLRDRMTAENPFNFKYITNLKSLTHFDDLGPSVVLASPGMLQSGLSRDLFEAWCTDARNGVIIAGYCVEGTLAKDLLNEPVEITSLSGQKLSRQCTVDTVSFSAHADFKQTSAFVRHLKPAHIILVHGEKTEMGRLKEELRRQYEDDATYSPHLYDPRNTQVVELHFRGEKCAKVVGRLASQPPMEDRVLHGILMKNSFNYQIMDPKDISAYSSLNETSVIQRQVLKYEGDLGVLFFHLSQLSEDVAVNVKDKSKVIRVFGTVDLVLEESEPIVLQWEASPLNDMYADTVLSAILLSERSSTKLKDIPVRALPDIDHIGRCVWDTLTDMFGSQVLSKDGRTLNVNTEDKSASVDLDTLNIVCDDHTLRQTLTTVVTKTKGALQLARGSS